VVEKIKAMGEFLTTYKNDELIIQTYDRGRKLLIGKISGPLETDIDTNDFRCSFLIRNVVDCANPNPG